jgi:GT2 family glycosyltransferase
MPLISALMVIFNSGEEVLDSLARLQAASIDIPMEIIVVDNASTNAMPERIQAMFPEIVYIRSEKNLGVGAGNNLAFRHSQGELVLCINPDLLLDGDALKTMQTYLQQHPDVGIVGPRTVDNRGDVTITARKEYTLWRIWAKYWAIDKLFPSLIHGDYYSKVKEAISPFDADWLQGSCLLIRREAYDPAKGFDEAFFLYMEDTDLCDRISKNGWRVIYIPQALARHGGGTTTSHYHLIRIRSYHQSPILYYRKRGNEFKVYLLKVIFGVELAGKIGVRWMLNAIKHQEIYANQLAAEWQILKEIWYY